MLLNRAQLAEAQETKVTVRIHEDHLVKYGDIVDVVKEQLVVALRDELGFNPTPDVLYFVEDDPITKNVREISAWWEPVPRKLRWVTFAGESDVRVFEDIPGDFIEVVTPPKTLSDWENPPRKTKYINHGYDPDRMWWVFKPEDSDTEEPADSYKYTREATDE